MHACVHAQNRANIYLAECNKQRKERGALNARRKPTAGVVRELDARAR